MANSETNISVMICTYNDVKTLCRAIESILSQTVPVAEIILIDDGSTDGTAQVAKKYASAIRYFYYENGGLAVARNRGIDHAKYDWIAFLDADDEWLPNYVASHVKLRIQHPEIKWSSCHKEKVYMVDNSHLILPIPQGLQAEIKREGTVPFFEAHMTELFGAPSGMLVNRSVFDEVGRFDPAMRNGQDRDMWTRIALKYPRIAVCPEVRWRYYVRSNSLCRSGRMYRDLHLKSICRNMRLAMAMYPEMVEAYKPYAKMLFMEYMMRVAARDCFVKSDTIEDAKSLFPLKDYERWLLKMLKLLPKSIALKVTERMCL